MSIYVKSQNSVNRIDSIYSRHLLVDSNTDTGEVYTLKDYIVHSRIVVISDPAAGWSTHDTGLPTPPRPRHCWIDLANSYVITNDTSNCYPIPYVNPLSWEDTFCCKLTNSGQTLVTQTSKTASWKNYEAYITIKWIDYAI